MNTSISVHMHSDRKFSASAVVHEHEYSNGPYPVVKLDLDGLEVVIFPHQNAAKLADTLEQLSAELREVVNNLSAVVLKD